MAEITFSPARLKKIVQRMQELRILVIGDLMLDEFVWGKVTRISPEAPVPVVHVTQETAMPGGAANVARNLADFGIKVGVCGVLGKDAAGENLARLLRKARMDTKGLFIENRFSTIVKTRIIARHQQVVRVDREAPLKFRESEIEQIRSFLKKEIEGYDAVIVEDYGKGFLTQEIYDEVAELAKPKNLIIAVDPNPNNPLNFTGATVVKPNRLEACAACGIADVEENDKLDAVGRDLLERWQLPYLLITLGEHGMMLYQRFLPPHHTPTRAREVFDVSGAGDTAISFFTAALAAGLNGNEAAEIANHAAGVVVSKLGTATLQPEELIEAIANDEKTSGIS
ncbi:MAG: D-glycero-beta-D-manno-heptose-7-phosphate kinase [Methylacidiphilales bacterium]|nr:D-glycero-beta-D-manno-heptose-7-phosphate kinase [Candidatus Methylacidiphilales bacterium]